MNVLELDGYRYKVFMHHDRHNKGIRKDTSCTCSSFPSLPKHLPVPLPNPALAGAVYPVLCVSKKKMWTPNYFWRSN